MRVPWWLKLRLKLVLSRLPFPYSTWKRLGLFQHGKMEQAAYARDVFLRHYEAAGLSSSFSGLELGPGDSLASALVARGYGASSTYLVDTGPYAMKDPRVYREMAGLLEKGGKQLPGGWTTAEEMLAACGAEYLTQGLESLRKIPAGSVDFIWSQAVLEHVRRGDFLPTLLELRRCLSAGGVMTHQIDLTDHLGGALNNLRFPESRWESGDWVRAGFYTNRLRGSEILALLDTAGFESTILYSSRWPSLPTPLEAMDPMFSGLGTEDLLTRELFLISRAKGAQPAN